MKASVVWTPQATSDLEEIVYYIATKDGRPLVAERVARELDDACRRYAGQPLTGVQDSRLGQHCRRFLHKRLGCLLSTH